MSESRKVKKVFAELLDSQLKRKADMVANFDRSIAQLNALQGAMNELDQQIANTRCAYDSYILLPDSDEDQTSIVDGSPLATEEETQQILDGLNTLAQLSTMDSSEPTDPLGGTSPKVAKVAPYTGATTEVWKPKRKKAVTNGDV